MKAVTGTGLGAKISLFGVPALTITGWHLLADAIAETTAVVLPATIATAAFGAAAVPTVQAIVQQFQNLNTVSGAFGKNLYPLTGGFSAVAQAVQPRVYQLLGDALVVLNSRMGEFSKLAQGAGQVFDNLAARATAALVSGGMSQFLKNAVPDLQKIGDVIGNIFGTVGNLLKTMPGYAETLLNLLVSVSRGLESFTNSGFVQGIVHMGLAFHGLFVYAGLLGTGLARVIPPILTGFSRVTGAAASAADKTDLFGKASTGLGTALAAMSDDAKKAAGAPWGWIAVAAAGVAILAYRIITAKDATQNWFAAQQQILNQQPAVKGFTLAQQDLAIVSADLANAQHNAAVAAKNAVATWINTAHQYTVVSTSATGAQVAVQDYSAAQKTLQGQISAYKTNLADLAKQFGGTTQAQNLMTQAGLTWAQVATKNKSQLASDILQMQAADSAFKAMALGTGREGAAMNALNISMGTGKTGMAEYLAQMQKIVQAEDQVTSVVAGSEQAFVGLVQGLNQTGKAASASGASLSGLGKNSLTLRNDFWNTVIPGMQKMIDTLNMQDVSTGNLTTAIATQTKEAIPWTKGNEAAKAMLVSMINNALGPGTVSLKTLNTWVGQNSTTMQGFSKIVDAATIKAGTLAGVLKNELNVQFHEDLLQVTGANAALKVYTADITNNTIATSKGQADRARLIKDLENSGMSAKAATAYVNGLSRSIVDLHGKAVRVSMTGTGRYSIAAANTPIGAGGGFAHAVHPGTFAAGGMIHGPGSPTSDSVPVMASRGEYIVKAASVAKYGSHMMNAINAGRFADGGMVGGNLTGGYVTGMYGAFQKAMTSAMVSAMRVAIHSAASAAASALGHGFPAGPGGGAPAANALLAQRMMPAWGSGLEWNAWNAVAMAESGWSQFARNPTSGAYGIPQALPASKMGPAANPPQSNPAAQIAWMIQYISSVYGDPVAAAAHENAYHWYGSGYHGTVTRPTLFGAGERGPERVDITPSGRGQTIVLEVRAGDGSAASRFIVDAIQKYVIVHGGDAQAALGQRA